MKSMNLAVSLDLPLSPGIKSSRTEPFSGKDGQKKPNSAIIRPQKADFVQILLLFRARNCMYDQAGSFPSTFIESRPSQGTLGKYFFNRNHCEPKERQIE